MKMKLWKKAVALLLGSTLLFGMTKLVDVQIVNPHLIHKRYHRSYLRQSSFRFYQG